MDLITPSFRLLDISVMKEDRKLFIFLGFCSFINVGVSLIALDLMSATEYAIMQPFIPVITTIISYLAKYERLNVYKLLGIVVAVTGAVLIEVWGASDDEDASNPVLGVALVLCAQVFFGCLIVFQKPLLMKYDPSVVTFVYYSIGSLITFLVCICSASRYQTSDLYLGGSLICFGAVLYAAVFATLFTYNGYSWVNRVLVSSVVTIYSTLQSLFTAILEFIFYGEIISLPQVMGGLLVAIGCVLTVKGRLVEAKEIVEEHVSDDEELRKEEILANDDNVQARLCESEESQNARLFIPKVNEVTVNPLSSKLT